MDGVFEGHHSAYHGSISTLNFYWTASLRKKKKKQVLYLPGLGFVFGTQQVLYTFFILQGSSNFQC